MLVVRLLPLICLSITLAEESHSPFEAAEKMMKNLQDQVNTLTHQLTYERFFNEQRIRAEGQSGISIQRLRHDGYRNYDEDTHTGRSAAAIHDHANNIRTVGMGEFTAVLNGIEFSTRHNDYQLYKSSKDSKEFHAVDEIEFPKVPQAVLDKATVEEQTEEMRQWFKAWRDQDHSTRDYREHFKPILCYLEGGWMNVSGKVEEPFFSDRHSLEAKKWNDLSEKVMFTAYSGSKSVQENLAFLPVKILEVRNGNTPIFAQFNYRILCHPISKDIPLKNLTLVEDLSSRMMSQRNHKKHEHSRAARYHLTPIDLLDEIMAEIPGKDNHPGHLVDEGYMDPYKAVNDDKDKTDKDVSRYHRRYMIKKRDAMGTSSIRRGFHDNFLFSAMTSQSKIVGATVKKCVKSWDPTTCRRFEQKWTYAIPLEIIYLTPLTKWNPYQLKYHGKHSHESPTHINSEGKWKRWGTCDDINKAYNGSDSRIFYQTPAEFFYTYTLGSTSADTSRGVVCVLDQNGNRKKVRASGTYVFLPNIKDVGVLRTRYPIFPVHGEGSSVWKELNALREIVLDDQDRYSPMKWSHNDEPDKRKNIKLTMAESTKGKLPKHTHTVTLTPAEVDQIQGGRELSAITSNNEEHQHSLLIKYNSETKKFFYNRCDNNLWKCADGHEREFLKVHDCPE